MIPGAVLFIPNFILIRDLGWLNTFQGMAAPYALITPFAVFFLRQVFLATPKDVEEAARIDGASYFSIFFRMILPMHRGSLATLAILVTVDLERVLLAFSDRAGGKRTGDCGRDQCVSHAATGRISRLDRTHGVHGPGNDPHDRSVSLLWPEGGRVLPI